MPKTTKMIDQYIFSIEDSGCSICPITEQIPIIDTTRTRLLMFH
jgi:hypothetical protein